MIWCIVKKDNCVASPVNPILVELQHKLSEEQFHNLGVGIGLGEAQVDVA